MEIFFPEPGPLGEKSGKPWTFISYCSFSSTFQAKTARRRLNLWINLWSPSNRDEILARLNSKATGQARAALWELYLNAFLLHQGFEVSRIEPEESNKTADFLIRTESDSWIVEAASIESSPKSTAEIIWKRVEDELRLVENDRYFISLFPRRYGLSMPKIGKLKNLILKIISQHENSEAAAAAGSVLAREFLDVGEWQFEIELFKRSRPAQGATILGMSGFGKVSEIRDVENLRNKYLKKQNRYNLSGLNYVIAVLENSFDSEDTDWHRYSALFGREVVSFTADGNIVQHRKGDGVWGAGKTSTKVTGMLLQGNLDIFQQDIRYPEYWVNPYSQNAPFAPWSNVRTFDWVDGRYVGTGKSESWDGLTDWNV